MDTQEKERELPSVLLEQGVRKAGAETLHQEELSRAVTCHSVARHGLNKVSLGNEIPE